MPLTPVHRRLAPLEIVDQVIDNVIDGDLMVGEPLPNERELAGLLGVSRGTVREALQRMAVSGVVDVRHGGSTTVRDFHRSGTLDLLPRLLVRHGELEIEVGISILEARLAIGPTVAAMAAERSGPSLGAVLGSVVNDLAATDDDVLRQLHALTFWDDVVEGAHSVVFQLMFNSLRAAYEPALEALAPMMAEEVGQVGAYRLLATAIGAGDAEAAHDAADRVLRPATERLLATLRTLDRTGPKRDR